MVNILSQVTRFFLHRERRRAVRGARGISASRTPKPSFVIRRTGTAVNFTGISTMGHRWFAARAMKHGTDEDQSLPIGSDDQAGVVTDIWRMHNLFTCLQVRL